MRSPRQLPAYISACGSVGEASSARLSSTAPSETRIRSSIRVPTEASTSLPSGETAIAYPFGATRCEVFGPVNA